MNMEKTKYRLHERTRCVGINADVGRSFEGAAGSGGGAWDGHAFRIPVL